MFWKIISLKVWYRVFHIFKYMVSDRKLYHYTCTFSGKMQWPSWWMAVLIRIRYGTVIVWHSDRLSS